VAFYRRIIKIKAEDSPNVRAGLLQMRAGVEPTGEMLVPGVLPWHDYVKRRETWDKVKQCIGLDAEFYEGGEVLLFPPGWLNLAEQSALGLTMLGRQAQGMGVDPAEGGDNTAFAVIDRLGLMYLLSYKTVDTQQIVNRTIALMRQYNLPADKVCFDRGGGGKQLADQLRARGVFVRTVAFGEPITPDPEPGRKTVRKRRRDKEEKYPYKNRRAEMYGRLREMIDPTRQAGYDGGRLYYESLRPPC
jgi:hypothetical protein